MFGARQNSRPAKSLKRNAPADLVEWLRSLKIADPSPSTTQGKGSAIRPKPEVAGANKCENKRRNRRRKNRKKKKKRGRQRKKPGDKRSKTIWKLEKAFFRMRCNKENNYQRKTTPSIVWTIRWPLWGHSSFKTK